MPKLTFIEFVHTQPCDRAIDHSTWHTCAVGDYIREVSTRRNWMVITMYSRDFPDMPESVAKTLNEGRGGDTYGELSSWLTLEGYPAGESNANN